MGKKSWKRTGQGKEHRKRTGFSPKESFLREEEVWDHMLERKDESI